MNWHQIVAQLETLNLPQMIPQVGFGGVLLLIIVRWLTQVMGAIERLDHTMRGLSKAIWLDLADRSAPGSFIREEAKRTVDRMKAAEDSRPGARSDV